MRLRGDTRIDMFHYAADVYAFAAVCRYRYAATLMLLACYAAYATALCRQPPIMFSPAAVTSLRAASNAAMLSSHAAMPMPLIIDADAAMRRCRAYY